MSIAEGKKAPAFALPRDGGEKISLKDFKGKPVVLYFYPKDMTPGCTTEACDFRDLHPDFEKLDAAVIGISKDSVKRHDNFRTKHELPFALASDEDGDVCERYGVWKEKSMYGKTFMGIERTTVLIDGNGVVRRIWPKVKVKGHAEEVLDAVRAL